MRAVQFIAVLLACSLIIGWGASGQVRCLAADNFGGSFRIVFRGESSGLADLEANAHARGKDDGKKRAEKRHSDSRCHRCKNSPCTCGGGLSLVGHSSASPLGSQSSDGNGFFGQLFVVAFTSPFSLPALLVGDDWDHVTEFPDYPYADDLPGSLLINSEYPGKRQDYKANLQLFAIPGSRDLDRFGGRLLLENADRIGIDTETDYWLQTHRGDGPDHAWMGDFNVVYRFAESENMQWRAGIGFNWLADQSDTNFGINFTYGVDWFPRRPWTVSTVFDLGTIGESTLFHNRTSVGLMMGAVEVFTGYDYFQLGTANFYGPVAGMGYHF